MTGKIAVGCLGTLGPDSLGTCSVAREKRLCRFIRPRVDQSEHRLDSLGISERQENPTPLLAALQHAGIGKDLQVPRDARLTLTKDLRQFSNRQLHYPQEPEDPQPSRVGKRLEMIGQG